MLPSELNPGEPLRLSFQRADVTDRRAVATEILLQILWLIMVHGWLVATATVSGVPLRMIWHFPVSRVVVVRVELF